MQVEMQLMYPMRRRTEVHRAERRIPESWIEAREKAAALPFDETQPIGEVFDRAIAKMGGAISRDRKKLRGVPCVRGTRIPVYQVCGMLAEGIPVRKAARMLGISEAQAQMALRCASVILEQ